ncbi:MAG: endonuclease/exonuclease/phosphatase family protein [Pedobacter sp.]|nr:MAG: endonuclease/exonuclease/phosphatase family protein [Pedobacter sp.]
MKKLFLMLVIGLLSLSVFAQKGQPLKVMSFNIRYLNKTDGENIWANRKDRVKELIQFYDVEILGVQEAMHEQFNDLKENTDFAVEGVGRDDGLQKGEHSPIYYTTSRFEKRDGGTFWLSETPDKPSKGWDAALPRVCTWLRLYDKVNKQEFMVFNTHYDHKGVQARIESAKLIKQKINQIAPKLPIILMGDLNVTPDTEAIETINSFLIDSRSASLQKAYGPEGTFNNFKLTAELRERIDYIFTNSQFKTLKQGHLSDHKDQRYYSDHLPVLAHLQFQKK